MQREILFVGRLRRGEKKEDLIGVLSRTVFVEEKKRTPVLRGQCAEQLRSTQRSGVQSHTYNQGVAKPFKAIGCSSLRGGGVN